MVSHSPKGIEGSYENFEGKNDKPNEDLLALFKQCIPFLLPETPATLKVELNETKTELEQTKTEFEQQKAENEKIITVQQKQIEETTKKLDDFMNYQQEKWQYEEDMNEVYFDYGYDSDTDKQASNKEVENNPQTCKAILEAIEEHKSPFKSETLNQWKEYLLNPEKRRDINLKDHWRRHSL